MSEASGQLPVHNESDTDARADRHIGKIIESLRRAPASLGERGTVDVRVDPDRNAEGPGEKGRERRIAPTGLGRAADAAEARRAHIEIERSKGSDAEFRDGPVQGNSV